jgi:eukaryotic-like serine/threonine-protein kinase
MVAALADFPDVPRAGDIIAGKYQVEEILGQGGMGVVVSARHLALGQRVAVKFLLPSATTTLPAAAERFLREARSAVAIQSEHVARVLDVATMENGAPYMVMEHLVGTDLRRVLSAQGRLSVLESVDYILQACEAIAEAHALGIIHRDLKPANIFVTTRLDGSPFIKVLDFGLSTPRSEGIYESHEATLTETQAVMGSPPYMSPEQIRSLKSVDARTDIWSIGVILYRLLAGRRPFAGETLLAICASIAADTPQPLTSIRPDVPPELDEIVRRCLAKEVSERVQTIAELAQGIAPFGSAEAQVSLNRISQATRGPRLPVPLAASASTPAPATPISTSRPLEVHDPSTAHASAWSQPRVTTKRSSLFPIVAIVVVVAAIAGIAIGSVQTTVTPTAASVSDRAIIAAPGPAAGETKNIGSAPTVVVAAAAPTAPAALTAPVVPEDPPKIPSSSPLTSNAPAARSVVPVTRSPVRPKAEPKSPANAKPVDPLERWK